MAGEVKCPECGTWNSKNAETCENCGHQLQQKEKEDFAQRQKEQDLNTAYRPLVEIKPNDPIIIKILKYPVRLSQMAFYAIAGFIGWLIYWATM